MHTSDTTSPKPARTAGSRRPHAIVFTLALVLGLAVTACGPHVGMDDPEPDAEAFTEMAIGLTQDGTSLVRLGGDPMSTDVVGLAAGTMLIAIDYRPADGLLYALASDGQLYTVDADGQAHAVGSPSTYGDLAMGAAIDFNPQVDALRVIASADGRNFVTDPSFGTTNEFTPSAFAEGDVHAGTMPTVAATAYDTNVAPFPGGGETVQYSIDTTTNVLAIQAKNMGTLATVGDLDMDVSGRVGFDISGATGTAYALLEADGVRRLYRIDLADATTTVLDVDVAGLVDLAIVPGGVQNDAPRLVEDVVFLSLDGTEVVTFDATGSDRIAITGLNDGTMLLALDHRPSNGTVYALGDDGQLYTLSTDGVASPVGAPATYGDLGQGVALDVNAQVDAIRAVTTADGRNFVIDADAGTATEFTASAFAEGDEHEGTMPSVAATAYDLNVAPFPDGSVTTQYSLEATANVLAIQGKNEGTLETIADIGFDVDAVAGLDVSGSTGTAYALLTMAGAQGFFVIDVDDASLTRLALPVSEVRDFTVVP